MRSGRRGRRRHDGAHRDGAWPAAGDDRGEPYVIADPVAAFVNLAGSAGHGLKQKDHAVLGKSFAKSVQSTEATPPKCNVLFLYGALEASGRFAGSTLSFRDQIKAAGARVAVLASELPPALLQGPDFAKALSAKNGWPANIVITLSRNGDRFARFFESLFALMQAGVSMPMAWVRLAPQGPVQPKDIPGTIALMEVGHIAFGAKKS